MPPLSVENDFTVGVKTTDLDFNVEIMTDERARFTTKGPVGFVSHYFFGSDTIPNAGDRLFMKITLRNDGAVATAENVAAFLSSPNSCVTITASNNNYGNIAPGANATIAGHYMIRFDNSCGTNTTIPIDLEISSNSYVYWNDSFSITLDPVGIPANSDKLPDKFALYQNYPNPFNPATAIQFALPGTEHVKLQIYNMAGQLIKTLINKKLQAGYHEAIWDGREQNGTKVASGIYFYKFTAGSFTKVRKMMYLK
ncbi:MAG: T9SS type A sorting domain-containing protein [Aliifodinibius sp.]|nr:T9SS type A sorting domain-containing protein [Fodinibius sp.]